MQRLEDGALEEVSGGMGAETERTKKVSCPICFEVFEVKATSTTATCPSCNKTFTINKKQPTP
jgi:protein-arginine kinase activator protein McsA